MSDPIKPSGAHRPIPKPIVEHGPAKKHHTHSTDAAHGGHSPAGTASHASTVGESLLERAHHAAEHTLKHMKKDLVDAGMGKFKNVKKGTKAWGRHLTKLQKVQRQAKTAVAASKTAKLAKVFNAGGKALSVAGPVLNGVAQYGESTAQTKTGKAVNALGAGVVDGVLTKAVPVVAAVDAAASLLLPDSVMKKTGGGINGTLNTSVRVITTTAEGLITGDTRGMEAFHEKSKKGDYGVVFQAASEAGDYWAQHGVVGGLKNAWSAIWD